MLNRKQIFDAITMDGILAVDGTGVQSIINRLMDLQSQNLQQTQCTMPLELLQQMLEEEQIAYMQSKNSMEVDTRLYNEDALKAVIKLINARQPIA